MPYDEYEHLRINVENGVAFVTFDKPPINLLDFGLLDQLARFADEVESDDAVRVIVFDSADPDFFLAHWDVNLFAPRAVQKPVRRGTLKLFHLLVEHYRTLPQVTIAQIAGAARGAGSEFALALDMRFGALGRAVLGQPEITSGIIPGGGGTQNLPRLVGRARAMEIILGGRDIDAELAERYGYLNRALPADELGPFVRDLALRIASYPGEALRAAKRAIDAGELGRYHGYVEEEAQSAYVLTLPEATRRREAFLAAGGQTREGELDFERTKEKMRQLL
ncbi:enoyl-CoA hydratase [Longimycelium tulufanense]|uniref:Enoyl-CoA hydratase n=1 Tax=Longimycelium tulufanense TaxID=907463 RepID=A0A8J3CD63_9PSEU|nr:enoyl-CoA hydratase/isomerase family protein [Longimycelium tulufanense]GGM50131.1 enoyl-CoA hydratase [Longimycelium tulufanense]